MSVAEEPLAMLEFHVREPVGINSKLKRGKGQRLYVSAESQAFAQRVAGAATAAKARCPEWPKNTYAAASVTLTLQLFCCRFDADAVQKPTSDALQGILYSNDRIVSYGPSLVPIQDDGGRRVEVLAELWAVHDAATAAKRERAAIAGRVKRVGVRSRKCTSR